MVIANVRSFLQVVEIVSLLCCNPSFNLHTHTFNEDVFGRKLVPTRRRGPHSLGDCSHASSHATWLQ
jgi:hypothetical protein